MKNYLIGVIGSEIGIQRDGTAYASQSYVDGLWVRFYEGYPRKIGGCVATYLGDETVIRSMLSIPRSPTGIYLYIGKNPITSANAIQYLEIDLNGQILGIVDRTPVAWTYSPDLVWSFDSGSFFEGNNLTGPLTDFVFAVAREENSSDLTNYTLYAGKVNSTDPLLPVVFESSTDSVECSGGLLSVPPVLVVYGNNGEIRWSNEDSVITENPGLSWELFPTTNQLIVANTKIIKAINILGGGEPTILLWSLNNLYKAVYTTIPDPMGVGPSTKGFIASLIDSDISLMSPNSVVTYNQLVFWVGIDQFYVYNGVVRRLSNTMNNDWFFNSINQAHKNKVWGVSVPRYKEIWWFYPRGESTECNAVIIYKVEDDKWYDNTIPEGSATAVFPFTRGAGVQASANYPFPLYADNTLVINPSNPSSVTYPIWTHEQGVDRVIQNQRFSIPSFYKTHLIDLWSKDGANSNLLKNVRIAPDFLQIGEMTVSIENSFYPNSVPTVEGPYPFFQNTEYVDFSSQGGICSFIFKSNVVGGDYFSGKNLYFYEKGDTLK